MDLTTIAILAHPAERHVVAAVAGSPCCSCCCCCSCCLHAVGGVGGGLAATTVTLARAKDRQSAGWGAAAYWIAFALFVGLSQVVAVILEEPLVGFILALLGLPLLQLAASVAALVAILVGPVRDKGAAAAAVGWITLWSTVAAVAGGIVMVVLLTLGVAIFSST